MSARIPDTALLSDLLKPTGYDCPERLQGKTFEESTTGEGNISIEANKEVTIAENGTVVINPSESKDAMEKVTVTVNVPTSGGGEGNISIEANKEVTIAENGTVVINPSESKDAMEKVTVTVNVPTSGGGDGGSSGGGAFRYFDARKSNYQSSPLGFWVIGKNQTSGNAHCLILSGGRSVDSALCVQPITRITSDGLAVNDYNRETYPEVTEDIVLAALGAQ